MARPELTGVAMRRETASSYRVFSRAGVYVGTVARSERLSEGTGRWTGRAVTRRFWTASPPFQVPIGEYPTRDAAAIALLARLDG